MNKETLEFICSQCHYKTIKWAGRCSRCNEWNTFVELREFKEKRDTLSHKVSDLINKSSPESNRLKLDWSQLSRVLGGGLVEGSMTLLAGEPGVGKSTLIIKLLKSIAFDKPALYVSGEEGIGQITLRAKRLQLIDGNIRFLSTTDINTVIDEVSLIRPSLVIIDSIQTLMNPDMLTPAGSVSQVKEVTQTLISKLKDKNITCLIIGHISKDGSIAGPKVLEHMVDTVLYFEKLKGQSQRSLICKKNRFGTTDEKGIFELTEKGLVDFSLERSLLKLKNSLQGYGCLFTIVDEGSRPLVFEIQTLVTKSSQTYGKRVARGMENSRLSLIVALLEKELKIDFTCFDIYVEVIGELKQAPSSVDLPIAVGIYSSFKNKRIPDDLLFEGKLNLNGRIVHSHKKEKLPGLTQEFVKLENLYDLRSFLT